MKPFTEWPQLFLPAQRLRFQFWSATALVIKSFWPVWAWLLVCGRGALGPLSCRAVDSVKGFSDNEPRKHYNNRTMASMVLINTITPGLAGGHQRIKALAAKPDHLGSIPARCPLASHVSIPHTLTDT